VLPKGVPTWVKGYADGYFARCIDELYRHELVYGGFIGERFYSTHRTRADYYEKHGIAPSQWAEGADVRLVGHYWISSVDHGTPRPFYLVGDEACRAVAEQRPMDDSGLGSAGFAVETDR